MNKQDLERLKALVDRLVVFALAKFRIPLKGRKIAHHKSPSTDDSQNWKEFWEENQPNRKFYFKGKTCPSCLLKKKENDFVGGHVVIEGKTYIIPVCDRCNKEFKGKKSAQHFFYVSELDMVRAPED